MLIWLWIYLTKALSVIVILLSRSKEANTCRNFCASARHRSSYDRMVFHFGGNILDWFWYLESRPGPYWVLLFPANIFGMHNFKHCFWLYKVPMLNNIFSQLKLVNSIIAFIYQATSNHVARCNVTLQISLIIPHSKNSSFFNSSVVLKLQSLKLSAMV